MVELAVADSPLLRCDDREISRQGRSFTVDTVRELRQDFGDDAPLFWIIGDDLLATLNQWSRWQSLADYCHLVVLGGGQAMSARIVRARWQNGSIVSATEIVSQPSGRFSFWTCR